MVTHTDHRIYQPNPTATNRLQRWLHCNLLMPQYQPLHANHFMLNEKATESAVSKWSLSKPNGRQAWMAWKPGASRSRSGPVTLEAWFHWWVCRRWRHRAAVTRTKQLWSLTSSARWWPSSPWSPGTRPAPLSAQRVIVWKTQRSSRNTELHSSHSTMSI